MSTSGRQPASPASSITCCSAFAMDFWAFVCDLALHPFGSVRLLLPSAPTSVLGYTGSTLVIRFTSAINPRSFALVFRTFSVFQVLQLCLGLHLRKLLLCLSFPGFRVASTSRPHHGFSCHQLHCGPSTPALFGTLPGSSLAPPTFISSLVFPSSWVIPVTLSTSSTDPARSALLDYF